MDEFTSVESYLRLESIPMAFPREKNRISGANAAKNLILSYPYSYAIIYLKENNPRIFDVIYKDVILSVIVS